jgi:hypothetical protein
MPLWMRATILPSLFAPSATRCSVRLRPPTTWKTPLRERASWTGRPATLAAAAQSIVLFHTLPLDPKLPPTYLATTRTLSGSSENISESVSLTP